MLEFKNVELSDIEWAKPLIRKSGLNTCEYSFTDIYLWRDVFNLEIARLNDFLIIKSNDSGENQIGFSFPAGTGDIKIPIDAILDYCNQNSLKFYMYGVSTGNKEILESLYPNKFNFENVRDEAEYVYTSESLITLKGKKLHAKRNHINKFKQNNWTFEPITIDNINECIEMNKLWCKENFCCENPEKLEESKVVKKSLKEFFELGLEGGLITVDGKIIAFAIGEALTDDMYLIHFEKALKEYQGSYAMINREFAEYAAKDFEFINREDDAGSEGLRKAKLSYYPAMLLEKYHLTVKEK